MVSSYKQLITLSEPLCYSARYLATSLESVFLEGDI
jgi:hypothetical protein